MTPEGPVKRSILNAEWIAFGPFQDEREPVAETTEDEEKEEQA